MIAIIHPSDERLERYVRGWLGAPDSPAVQKLERHLLNCPHCILKAERKIEFAQIMRGALATLRGAR